MADMEIRPIILEGGNVRLEPLTEAHVPALAEIGVGQGFWNFMVYGDMRNEEDMRRWVMDILSRAEKRTDLPFAVV
ncbi:MAG TPA: hypothetical protein VK851_09565, partial [Anaerolineales bacterium]|nr:hypothetical protein [Anaerolineales bacterium]